MPEGKQALIIGISGQDGSYLAEHLLKMGYAVHGLVRRASLFNRARIDPLRQASATIDPNRLHLHYADLHDVTSIRRLLTRIQPDEIYHLAGQSHVGLSFEIPEVTTQDNALSVLSLLEIVRDLPKPARLYHASSSEIFGNVAASPQDEETPIEPVSPYGCAKAFATHLGRTYRKAYGLFVCNGIAYNHESPRRGENFVTRKISLGAARIKAGEEHCITLGNLDAGRDWGYAPEYVVAMQRSLAAAEAADYVLATGKSCTVREFLQAAFAALELPLTFEGSGSKEVARRTDSGAIVVRVDARFYRPIEPQRLVGNPARAKSVLGWEAQTAGPAVARAMALADFELQKARRSGEGR